MVKITVKSPREASLAGLVRMKFLACCLYLWLINQTPHPNVPPFKSGFNKASLSSTQGWFYCKKMHFCVMESELTQPMANLQTFGRLHILTWPMAKLQTFWDYIFSRENKVQTFFFRVHWLSEYLVGKIKVLNFHFMVLQGRPPPTTYEVKWLHLHGLTHLFIRPFIGVN